MGYLWWLYHVARKFKWPIVSCIKTKNAWIQAGRLTCSRTLYFKTVLSELLVKLAAPLDTIYFFLPMDIVQSASKLCVIFHIHHSDCYCNIFVGYRGSSIFWESWSGWCRQSWHGLQGCCRSYKNSFICHCWWVPSR